MKFSDYRRLAKISLKSRKKTTRATVRGISFGLILIMPVLFIFMAFYIGLNTEVNKEKDIRTFNLGFTSAVTTDSSCSYVPTSKFNDVLELQGVDEYVKYQKYAFTANRSGSKDGNSNSLGFTVVYNGTNYTEFEKKIVENRDFSPTLTVYDLSNSKDNNVFLSNDGDALVEGKSFSKDSKNEIMISNKIADKLSKNPKELIGKNISLKTKLTEIGNLTSSKTKNTSNEFETIRGLDINILTDFKIVGIFNSDICEKTYRSRGYNGYDELFWITNDSVYNTKGESYTGTPVSIEENNGYSRTMYYYPTSSLVEYSETANEAGYAFIPLGASVEQEGYMYSGLYYKEYGLYLSFDSYKNADRATTSIDSYIESTSSNTEKYIDSSSYKNNIFATYQVFYQVFLYLSLALAIFGGVIFFATLLNLYNTIEFSVQTRKNYLGLLRAIGMKNNSITKLYFVEVLKIFTRSYIWTVIFGGGICVGIYFAFKAAMNTDAAKIISMNLTLNPVFIPIAFIILVVFDTLIALVFALISCHKVSHKPLLEVLVDDK